MQTDRTRSRETTLLSTRKNPNIKASSWGKQMYPPLGYRQGLQLWLPPNPHCSGCLWSIHSQSAWLQSTLCGAPPLGLVQLRASETPSHVPRHGPLVNAAWMSSDLFLVLPLTQDQCAYRDPTRGKLPLKTELLVSFGIISLHHDKVGIRGGTLHQVVPELSLNMFMS